MNTYYPIGTIVRLSIDEDMLFMIAGYLTRQGEGKIYDYFAVPFPFGLMKENQYLSFNHDRITEVVHVGYCDEECQMALDAFDELTANIHKVMREGIPGQPKSK